MTHHYTFNKRSLRLASMNLRNYLRKFVLLIRKIRLPHGTLNYIILTFNSITITLYTADISHIQPTEAMELIFS